MDGKIVNENFQFESSSIQQTHTQLHIRETEIQIPYDYSTDPFELLSNTLVFDTGRNAQIVKDLDVEIHTGKKILVLTERKNHIEILKLFLNKISYPSPKGRKIFCL